jgi:hypothetical protein
MLIRLHDQLAKISYTFEANRSNMLTRAHVYTNWPGYICAAVNVRLVPARVSLEWTHACTFDGSNDLLASCICTYWIDQTDDQFHACTYAACYWYGLRLAFRGVRRELASRVQKRVEQYPFSNPHSVIIRSASNLTKKHDREYGKGKIRSDPFKISNQMTYELV